MLELLEGFLHLFSRRPVTAVLMDVLDILVVTYVVYRALLVLRGTRAMQMGTGLGIIFLIYLVSKWAGLTTLFSLLKELLASIILIIVVVFQNDIRRGLMRVGARAFFGGLARQQESKAIDEVVAAATELARHRIGALIAFEQDANLDEFVVGQGTPIDASVQRELLVSLFLPESLNKLHDGAVVIRNLRVAKAGVFFPMPDTKLLDKSLGSRHRAALGITEETDAVVVVVSEERGNISFCFNGNIVSNLDGTSLRQALLGLFGQRARNKRGPKGGQKRAGAVMQTGTGSFRITPPQSGSSSEARRASEAPPPPTLREATGSHVIREGTGSHVTREATGSHVIPPAAAPNETSASKSDATEAAQLHTRPMAPAKPIETPKPAGAPVAPTRPREE
jgi:diadenylate cyclase